MGELPQCVGVSRDALASVDASCNQLVGVAVLVSAPLQRLCDALSQRRGGGGGGRGWGGAWRAFVEANRQYAVVSPAPDQVQFPYLLRPLHASQHALLLQVSYGGNYLQRG